MAKVSLQEQSATMDTQSLAIGKILERHSKTCVMRRFLHNGHPHTQSLGLFTFLKEQKSW